MQTADVVIVGGGIWGLSTADHLSRHGAMRVVVLERAAELAAETTPQSAGQVGQLRGDAVLARAVGYTLQQLSEYAARTGHDPAFVQSGSLHVALNAQRARQFDQLQALAADLNYQVHSVAPSDVPRWARHVDSTSIVAALHVPGDGYVDARACALAYAAAARDRGVEFHTQCEVTQIDVQGPRVHVRTTQGDYQTPHVVLTAGPWTQRLTRDVGFTAPMYPIRLQQARTVADHVSPRHPVLRVPDESCYVRPEHGAYLFGFFDPDPLPVDLSERPSGFSTHDVRPEPTLIDTAIHRLTKVLPRLAQLNIHEYRQGMMTCTPDGKFVLGPVPTAPHVLVATGCGGTGIAASAAVGKWLSEWVTLGAPRDDVAQYAPGRFGSRADDTQWLRNSACATSAAYYRLPAANTQ